MEENPIMLPSDFLSEVNDRKRQLDGQHSLAVSSVQRDKIMEGKKDNTRADEFLRRIRKPRVVIPDPAKDFHIYERMSEAMDGLHEHLDRLRRNYGAVGYSSQNLMSDLTKAYIDEAQVGSEGSEEEMAFLDHDMEQLSLGINESSGRGDIAEVGNRFSRTMWQERLEADLFGKIWPVIVGRVDEVPAIISWKNFQGNIQAYLYGFLDVVSELAKALTEELSRDDMTIEKEFQLFQRYLVMASSITLRLSQERHAPGYVINNGYGPWMAYTRKLRTVYGTIAYVRREYNLRRSMERMIQRSMETK